MKDSLLVRSINTLNTFLTPMVQTNHNLPDWLGNLQRWHMRNFIWGFAYSFGLYEVVLEGTVQ